MVRILSVFLVLASAMAAQADVVVEQPRVRPRPGPWVDVPRTQRAFRAFASRLARCNAGEGMVRLVLDVDGQGEPSLLSLTGSALSKRCVLDALRPLPAPRSFRRVAIVLDVVAPAEGERPVAPSHRVEAVSRPATRGEHRRGLVGVLRCVDMARGRRGTIEIELTGRSPRIVSAGEMPDIAQCMAARLSRTDPTELPDQPVLFTFEVD